MILARLVAFLALASTSWAWSAPPTTPAPAISTSLIGEAEAAISAGDDRAAESLLSRLPAGSLDAVQLARAQIVRAEIGLHRRQPDFALRALPPSSHHIPALSSRMEQLRAQAQFMLGDAVSAVRTLVARERSLTAANAITQNREQIWNGLVSTPIPAGAFERLAAEDPMTRGWLDLARVLQQGAAASEVAAWQQRNPGHPGQAKTALIKPGQRAPGAMQSAGLAQAALMPTSLAGGYALLLPISGELAAAGRALRDGFIAAWFDLPEPRLPLRVYDTGNDAAQATAAYQSAVRDGAGFMVGPLTKVGVVAVASQSVGVPWLTLNYVDGLIPGATQFGLAPEDEARAAALDAIATGRRQALTLAPSNPWGERALAAFNIAFLEQGGSVLQSTRYAPGTQDFGTPLRSLLALDASQQRHLALERILGEKAEFEPRPRDDAELLFAPLNAAEARALAPQLDFFRARDLAAYTISAAHSGRVDRQLDGLRLCDMPWVLDDTGTWNTLRQRARDLFPEAMRDQPRLFALGGDALRLARARDQLARGREVEGATGRLSLAAGNRVVRNLSCRPIIDGRPSASP